MEDNTNSIGERAEFDKKMVEKNEYMPVRSKRGVLMSIQKAEKKDLQEILDLQYIAYQSEAKLLGNGDIPPLRQTIEEVKQEFEVSTFLKLIDEDNKIIGSVRAYIRDKTLFIGKLIVHPDYQGQGLGTKLLYEIERVCPHERCELFTSSKSQRNIQLYQRLGYKVFNEQDVSNNLKFIYLEKL